MLPRPLTVYLNGSGRISYTAFRWMATFLFVNLTWVIFRSESISQAKLFLKRLLDFENMQINPSFMDSFKMVELPLWLTGHRVFTVLVAVWHRALPGDERQEYGRGRASAPPSFSGAGNSPPSGLVRPVPGRDIRLHLFSVLNRLI